VAAVQYTFTHKQHTEYREWNIQYITIKTFNTNLKSAGRAPSLRVIPWQLPYISVIVAARTQADTVQYKKKTVQYTKEKQLQGVVQCHRTIENI
jgi:hypothetical protein